MQALYHNSQLKEVIPILRCKQHLQMLMTNVFVIGLCYGLRKGLYVDQYPIQETIRLANVVVSDSFLFS